VTVEEFDRDLILALGLAGTFVIGLTAGLAGGARQAMALSVRDQALARELALASAKRCADDHVAQRGARGRRR